MIRYIPLLLVAGCKTAASISDRDLINQYSFIRVQVDSVRHLALVGALLAMPGAIILYLWVVRPVLKWMGRRQ